MRAFTPVVIGLATLGLAADYALTERWVWVGALLLMGLLWLAEPWHGGRWVATAALLFFTAVAVAGVLLELRTFWLFTSLVAALVAWDLDHFANYLSDAPDVHDKTGLINSHFRRLGFVAGLGWFLGVVALRVRLTFNFVLTLALALLIVIALSGAIRQMRRESEQD
jgi:hypothetical protein